MPGEQDERASVSRTVEESYDDAVARTAPALAAALSAVLGLTAVLDLLLLDGSVRTALTAASAVAAGVLAVVAVGVRLRGLPPHLAHPLTASMLAVAAGNGLGHMVLADLPSRTTDVLLVLVASGALLLSLRWLLGFLYLTWGTWALSAVVTGPSRQWSHLVAAMVTATLVGVAVNLLRRRGLQALAEARAEVEAARVRDQLTGLANRRGLALVGGQMVEQARRQGDAVHCLFVDIDDLKSVNDALGHAAGDDVLVAVGEALRSVTRGTDVVARWGGDEFCVVGPGAGMSPLELERRVRDNVLLQQPVPPEVWSVRVSVGGAMLAPWDAGTLDTLLGKADQEMYLRRSLRREGSASAPRGAPAE